MVLIGRVLYLSFTIALLAGQPSNALVLAAGNNTKAPADDPGWANVGKLTTGLNVIYLGGGWVLTADHVGVGDVVLAGQTYAAVAGSGYQLLNPDSTPADLLLFQINGPPPLPYLSIANGPPTTTSIATLMGGGASRGSPTSWTAPPPDGTTYYGFLWADAGYTRWGTAPVSMVGQSIYLNGDITHSFATQFTPVGGTTFPAQAGDGDSGGAAFIKLSGNWLLAGVLFAIDGFGGQPASTALYGNHTYAADLSFYRNEILAKVVPQCGDGIIEPQETCDDGNTLNGDGCSSACQVETGWTCSGQPSVCTELDTDGDGIPDLQDNCPYTPNGPLLGTCLGNSPQGQALCHANSDCTSGMCSLNQEDTGGVGSGSPPDGIGDVCQCGDVNNDGIVNSVDVTLIQRALVGVPPYPGGVTTLPGYHKCQVTTGSPPGDTCNYIQTSLISRAVAGLAPGILQGCHAATTFP